MTLLQPDLQAILNTVAGWFDTTPVLVRRVAWNVLVTLVVAWVAWQVIKLVARRIVLVAAGEPHEGPASFHEKRANTIARLLRSIGWGVLMVFVIIQMLRQFIDITVVLGGFSVVGLAVSFGAQSLVKDYFAGFFILFENQFVVGDVVEAAGKSGVVEHLTLRAVRLRDLEGTVHIIPNGQITTLSNKTRGWSRAVIDFAVSYREDLDRVIALLREEAMAFYADPQWSEKFDAPPEVLGVESFADHGVNIRVLLRTVSGMQWDVGREFRRRGVLRLEHDGVDLTRAQQTVRPERSGLPPVVAAPAASPIPGSA